MCTKCAPNMCMSIVFEFGFYLSPTARPNCRSAIIQPVIVRLATMRRYAPLTVGILVYQSFQIVIGVFILSFNEPV